MTRKINVFFIFRIVLGALFVFSGLEKILAPFQNFLYVIQNYEFLPGPLEKTAAIFVPWAEVLLGTFLLAGLWLRQSLSALLILILLFIIVVGQAIIRGLPLEECGCFGGAFVFPLRHVILMDSFLLFITGGTVLFLEKTSVYSLDEYFSSQDVQKFRDGN